MFETLSGYERILVTGAHRSGTTIAAAMIARDTGKEAIFEEAFSCHDIGRLQELFKTGTVVQAPYALPWLPIFADEDTALVLMRRPRSEVEESQRRLTVSKPYFTPQQAELIAGYHAGNGLQMLLLDYAELCAHPMWEPRENRQDWHHRQIAC